ncbi:uncharacterized protein B0T15DRAFT_8701 [Chaetomium strumarium]|uniref:DUF541 domain-containing protein n=1 Tax=Chaetomium strumarium TaxID=1170767 RepID=A0AAJ0M5H4_9PEZI|nr:hypothetical protein B0T15DRAFT_8701 [Chaetomium strumarium]
MGLKIHTIGTSTLSRAAEQAVLTLEVSSTGPTQSGVSHEVTTTSNLVQSELEAHSSERSTAERAGPTTSPSADEVAVSHWSMSSLSTGSYIPWDAQHGEEQQRNPVYTARTTFEVTFGNFARLGQIVSNLANMPHVSVVSIEWRLTTPTRLEMSKASRKLAIEDAVNKATDYAAALGRARVDALEVSDTDMGGGDRPAVAYMASMGRRMKDHQEESLHFTPQNCEVHCSVKVLFEASKI